MNCQTTSRRERNPAYSIVCNECGKELKLIHQYKNNGYNIVLDVNSGSVHVVDDLVYDAIAYMVDHQLGQAEQSVAYEALKEKFSDSALSEIVDEIYELKEQGMLFTEDI